MGWRFLCTNLKLQWDVANVALQLIQFPIGAKVLDIGCGDGLITQHFATFFPEISVLGIDHSGSMIEHAQKYNISNLFFEKQNVAELSCSSKFDRIVSFNCLHWVVDIESALSRISQALVKGGCCLLLVLPQPSISNSIHRIADHVAQQDRWSIYFNKASTLFPFLSAEHWKELIN